VRAAGHERLLHAALAVVHDVRAEAVRRRLAAPLVHLHADLLRFDLDRGHDLDVVFVRVEAVLPGAEHLLDDAALADRARRVLFELVAREELPLRDPVRGNLLARLADEHAAELLRHLHDRVDFVRVEERIQEVPAFGQQLALDPLVRRVGRDQFAIGQRRAPAMRDDEERVGRDFDARDRPEKYEIRDRTDDGDRHEDAKGSFERHDSSPAEGRREWKRRAGNGRRCSRSILPSLTDPFDSPARIQRHERNSSFPMFRLRE
jgi:hypothetical protein